MSIRSWLQKRQRRSTLKQLAQMPSEKMNKVAQKRRVSTLKGACSRSVFYKKILDEQKCDLSFDRGLEHLWSRLPILDKHNTFEKFDLSDLIMNGRPTDIASVLTSSGHSGVFSFGICNRKQYDSSYIDMDMVLEQLCGSDQKKTLVINMLPMGVRFSCSTVAIAETSVHEDMAFGILTKLERYFEQVILVSDPLFLNRFFEYAREKQYVWPANKVGCIIGEETFHENFRDYVASQLNTDLSDDTAPLVNSSMGVGELGLNLFFETRETIRIKRALDRNDDLFRRLFGFSPERGNLMLFSYNPLRTHIEANECNADKIGDLLVSILGLDHMIPLLRYRTGDRIRLLQWEEVSEAFSAAGLPVPNRPSTPLVALQGRDRDVLSNGVNLSRIKDLLYKNPSIAQELTGAWRMEQRGDDWNLNLQLNQSGALNDAQIKELSNSMPMKTHLKIWSYSDFPFGVSTDYERKFCYFEEQTDVAPEIA
ncbi:hypothetical protein PsAD14_00631 [Pseudovibrio sp. Ad14]|nr:hypothetical protein PsW74_02501 [Pseudovibrio sp. W74]KZL11720.1 hypothetical protein PsAD14_00631 [Pseudovibrio sp. Ad14]